MAALSVVSTARAPAADERPRVDIPLAESAETFAAAALRIARLVADDWGVRGMWRGRFMPNHTAVLVVWFESKAQTRVDPSIMKEAEQLFDRLRPELARMATLDVVVLKPFLPIFLGDYAQPPLGRVWIREGRSWRRPAAADRDREIVLAVMRELSGRPPSDPLPRPTPPARR